MKNEHNQSYIEQLEDRIKTLEYILAQTLTLALRADETPEQTLADMKHHFAKKIVPLDVSAASPTAGYESAQRIYTSARESF